MLASCSTRGTPLIYTLPTIVYQSVKFILPGLTIRQSNRVFPTIFTIVITFADSCNKQSAHQEFHYFKLLLS
jgi:Sec-independent protein secretion pathway component TatC